MTERKEEENMKRKRVENKEGKIEGNNSKLNASCWKSYITKGGRHSSILPNIV